MDAAELKTLAAEIGQQVAQQLSQGNLQSNLGARTASSAAGQSIEGGVVMDEGNFRKGEEAYQLGFNVASGHHQRMLAITEAQVANNAYASHLANLRSLGNLDSGVEESAANALLMRGQTAADVNTGAIQSVAVKLAEAMIPKVLEAATPKLAEAVLPLVVAAIQEDPSGS